jgi:hypothetical protein
MTKLSLKNDDIAAVKNAKKGGVEKSIKQLYQYAYFCTTMHKNSIYYGKCRITGIHGLAFFFNLVTVPAIFDKFLIR